MAAGHFARLEVAERLAARLGPFIAKLLRFVPRATALRGTRRVLGSLPASNLGLSFRNGRGTGRPAQLDIRFPRSVGKSVSILDPATFAGIVSDNTV